MSGAVLVVTCVYPPEPVVSARTSQELSEHLAEKGYKVEVIAPYPSRPSGQYSKAYESRFAPVHEETLIPNLSVTRFRTFASKKSSILSRLLENLSFGVVSFIFILLRGRKYSAVYINTWPLFAVLLTILPAKLWKLKVTRSVQDLYPASLTSQGRMGRGFTIALLSKIESLNFNLSETNIFLSKEMRDQYDQYCDPDDLSRASIIIPNWGRKTNELPLTATGPKDYNLSAHMDAIRRWSEGSRLLIYGGNISVSSGLTNILSNMPDLEVLNLKLLIAGSGSELEACQEIIRARGLRTVRFFSPWPKESTIPILSCADVFLLPTLPGQSINSLPSKLLDYMGLSRPVLCIADEGSTLKNLFDSADIGFCTTDTSEEKLRDALTAVSSAKSHEINNKGKNAREYLDQNLTSDQWLPVLEGVLF